MTTKEEKTIKKIISINGISKRFKDQHALADISVSINKGEVVSIIGPSGAGKSTFLRMLVDLEKPDNGSICINDEIMCQMEDGKDRVSGKNKREILMDVGMVFQSFNLFPHMRLLENVTEALITVKRMKREDAVSISENALRRVRMLDKINSYPSELSGGEKQRGAIARVLAAGKGILLFDEPTSALDPEATQGVVKVIEEMAEEDVTLVLVTHEIKLALNVSDKIIFMEKGRIGQIAVRDDKGEFNFNDRLKTFVGSS